MSFGGSAMVENLRGIPWLQAGIKPVTIVLVTLWGLNVLRRLFSLVKVARVRLTQRAVLPDLSSESARIDYELLPETIHPLLAVHFTRSAVHDFISDRRPRLALGAAFPEYVLAAPTRQNSHSPISV
jgi:hypothetical protein